MRVRATMIIEYEYELDPKNYPNYDNTKDMIQSDIDFWKNDDPFLLFDAGTIKEIKGELIKEAP